MQKYSNSGEETNRFSSATMSDLNVASKMMSAQLGSMPPNGMGGMDDVAAMAAAAAAAAAAKQHHLKQARSFDDEDERRANSMPRPQLASMLSHSTTVGQSSDEDDDEDDVYSNSVGGGGGHGSSSYPHHLSQATSHHPHLHTSLSSGGMPTNRQRHESSYSNSSLSRYDSTESPRYPASHHAGGSTSMDADRNNNSRYGSGGPPPPGMDPHHHHAYGSDSSCQMIKKPRGELTCVVCGAAANGYNFDAITCESCKAFFRRNAFRPINLFRCSNNNACQITVATRKKCKKCRIMKCFNLGMRRDWIMTEVEREEKRRKIAMNKTKTGGPVHMDESSQESTSTFLNDSQYAGSHAGYDQQSDGEMMGGGINNKPIRRRRRRRRAGFGAGPPLDLGVDSQSPHIPSSASYNNMHGYGLNTYGHSEESHHRSPYIPSQHHHSSSHTSPATAHRHPYSPAPSSYYDPRSVQPPGSVGASSAGPYSVDQGGYDELMAKRKRRTMDGLPDDGSMLDGDYLSKSNSNLSSSVAAAGQQRMGLLESYKLSNSDKIVVGQDVEFKTKVTELERTQIDAILEAYKQAIKLVKAHGIPKSSEDINTTINLTELGVRRLIFFFKLISDFRNLDHDLMVKLLKKNMMNLIQIHGVNSYNKVEDTFKEPDSDDTPFAASSLESIYGPDIYKLTIGITQNLFDLCEGDTTYIKVLLLIMLFDPLNEHLSEAERVQVTRLQNKYVTLFHAYMCDSFGTDKGRITFKSVLYEMNKVNDLAQWFEKVVAEKTNYEYVRPLMKEMFNLPHHEGGSSTTAAGGSTTETSTPPASVAAAQTPGVSANALL